MTAPVRAIDEVTSYSELIAGVEAGRIDLGIKQLDFDHLAGFAAGSWGKAAGMLGVRQLRLEFMFAAIRAAGLRLRLEIDPDQQAKMKARIEQNYIPRQANQARPGHSASLPSTAVLNRVMQPWRKVGGKKRWNRKSKEDRSAHMSMMANARWKRERKKRKAAKARRNRAKVQEPTGAVA